MSIKISPTDVPNKKSTALDWISWHTLLKRNYGKKNANYLFTKAWNKRGGVKSPANTSDLRDYLKKQGIQIDKDWTASVVDTAGDLADNLGDFLGVGKIFGIAIAVIVVGGAGLIIYNVARRPVETITAVAKLKGGR